MEKEKYLLPEMQGWEISSKMAFLCLIFSELGKYPWSYSLAIPNH
jgi:hypothetical protein